MQIRLRGLVISNFKCFVGKAIELDLKPLVPGLHFVKGENQVEPALGSNGSGKSSCFDAICWCLYSRTSEGLRNPDIRPWGSDKLTSVEVYLEKDDKPFHIIRKTPNNSLTVNGETVGQEWIDKELMSFPVFTNTLLLGQGRPLFFDLTPQGKMDLFVDVLELDRWDVRSQVASDEAKRLASKEMRLTAEIEAGKVSLKKFMSFRNDLVSQKETWEVEKGHQTALLHSQIKALKVEVSNASEQRAELESDIEELRKTVKLNKERYEEHSEELRSLELSYRELLALKGKAKIELQKLDAAKGKTCPTCGQLVQRGHLDRHRKELKSLIEDPRIEEVAQDVVVAKDTVDGTKKVLDVDRRKLEEMTIALNRMGVDRAKASTRLAELELQLQRYTDEENPYLSQLRTLRSDIKQQKEALEELEDDLSRTRRRMERVKFWVQGFKACRLYMLEEVLDELRLVSNSIGPELGLDGWRIEFAVEKENKSGTISRGLTVSITSPETDNPVRWEAFSGGERQRLRLVGALSLSEVLLNHAAIDSDFEILDEPTRHLSVEGISDLCEALPERAKRLGRRTFYVDHTAVESINFSSVLVVRRTKNGVEIQQ